MSYLGLFGGRDIDDHGLGFSVWPGIRIMLILSRLFVQGYESCSYLGLFGARDTNHVILRVIWCQGYR